MLLMSALVMTFGTCVSTWDVQKKYAAEVADGDAESLPTFRILCIRCWITCKEPTHRCHSTPNNIADCM